ncbi:MAG: hypothetical protein GY870_12620 [archaeon]|nr:hypothetical protein [archaeon]
MEIEIKINLEDGDIALLIKSLFELFKKFPQKNFNVNIVEPNIVSKQSTNRNYTYDPIEQEESIFYSNGATITKINEKEQEYTKKGGEIIMVELKELLTASGFEINKTTNKMVRAKGVVSEELLANLMSQADELGITHGKIDIPSSQIFLFLAKPKVEDIIAEPVRDIVPDVEVDMEDIEALQKATDEEREVVKNEEEKLKTESEDIIDDLPE